MKEPNLSIYISSCDKYSDLWPGLLATFQRYWTDNPFPIFIGTGKCVDSLLPVQFLQSDPSLDWSSSVLTHLRSLRSEYVLFMLDDFFLRADVQTDWLRDIVAQAAELDAAMIRLLPRPRPSRSSPSYPYIGECDLASEYSICTQAAVWRREDLMSVLCPGESIWLFEQNVRGRSGHLSKRILACDRPALPYRGLVFHHMVEKGCWIPSAYLWCKVSGVPCDVRPRRMMPISGFVLLCLAESFNLVLSNLFRDGASRVRRKVISVIPNFIYRLYSIKRSSSPPTPL